MKAEYPSYGNYVPIMTTDVDGRFPTVIYESKATKVKLVVLQVDGPLVNGYMTVATEAMDDDGLPHTLEHLVFMGSEDYPYKGVLDLLATRCLSPGTNAWTAVDHTCYTMTTAGTEGFCSLLPIYLDHVLYPLLKDSAFTTEVHHVNGDGEDAGVVYSEMQTHENCVSDVTFFAMQRALFPNSGFKSNTGGALKNLRESCSNAKVRAYHKAYYRPENLWIIVTGKVDPLMLLKSVEPIENKILSKGTDPGSYVRPWSSPVEPLLESVDNEVCYPADEEDNGVVYIGWRGPLSVVEQPKLTVLSAILDYLVDTPISPVRKTFVEIESPYASGVSASIDEYGVSGLFLYFEDVPIAKMTEIAPKLWKVLRSVDESTLDLDRMKTILRKQILDTWAALESRPHRWLARTVNAFMVYGSKPEELTFRLNETKYLEELMTKDAQFWIGFLRDYMDESKPHVVIRARPSIELKAKIAKEEKERIRKRVEELGPDGLEQKKEMVQKAVRANEVPPDDKILTSIPIPGVGGIHFHAISTYSNFQLPGSEDQAIKSGAPNFDLSKIPIRIRVDDVDSNFVHMRLIIDTTGMSPELRLYLPLYLEAITECPLKYPPGIRWGGESKAGIVETEDGHQIVPFELVVAQVEADAQSLSAYLGVSGGGVFTTGAFSNYAVFSVDVDHGKYVEGIRWLRDLLYYSYFDPSRVQVIAAKLAQSVSQKKRDGRIAMNMLITDMDFVKESNCWAVSMIRQHNLLNDVSQNLSRGESGEEPKAIASLRAVQRFLSENCSGVMLHFATGLARLNEKMAGVALEEPLLDVLLPKLDLMRAVGPCPADIRTPPAIVPDSALVVQSPMRMTAGGAAVDPKHACALGMGSVDSAFLIQTLQVGITNYTHPDYAALALFLEYLQQLEGPLWRGIRGPGFAYHYQMRICPEEGRLMMGLEMAAQLVDGYEAFERILREHIAEDFKVDKKAFDSAKSSSVFRFVSRESSITDVVGQSLLSSFRGVPIGYSKVLIDRILKVTPEEMLAAGRKYVTPLLDPALSRCAIVCHSEKLKDLVVSFEKIGRPLHEFESIEDSFLSHL